VVEGASAWTIILPRKRSADINAPSTTLRSLRELQVVPLPRFAGAEVSKSVLAMRLSIRAMASTVT